MEWNIIWNCVFGAILSTCASCFDRLELPAYEYQKRFQTELLPGKCPSRIIQYPESVYSEPCTFPNRAGIVDYKFKPAETTLRTTVTNASQLMSAIGLCDAKSTDYFGLLSKGDCLASEIAGMVDFKSNTATFLYVDHYRPWVKTLIPTHPINIPPEYRQYLNNSFFTESISIGSEEILLVEMHFPKEKEATVAGEEFHTPDMLAMMMHVAKHVGTPRKIKVVRVSTSDQVVVSKVFRGEMAIFEAMHYVEECENAIEKVRRELQQGVRHSHLKYSFKAYEIGPIAMSLQSVSDKDKQQAWEQIALVQVEAKRLYNRNKRYRKFCKSTTLYGKYCKHALEMVKELKKLNTHIHTQRRDWLKMPYEKQIEVINSGKRNIKLYTNTMRTVSKQLNPILKKRTKM
ncbi:uncharacterized protein LOC127836261 [Dreissena polymorpha]|uniref:Uncharacterized protein n=1 Tax=Dreissena polymorpha TaxID=45954 RepID=A0A9D4JD29_DREPO|nr:uncharacterized protein LOC127836261 [Dreissena polymorpha]XP_052218712.1 uncharacterized protein LOC127836261 [Dreissena polymorpha]KAH3807260.1 hypothetical protein DPMN_135595 [Dreissena polymorpha]